MCSIPTRIDAGYQIAIEQDVAWGRGRRARALVWGRGRPARTAPGYALSRVDFLKEMRDFLHSGALLPLTPLLARVEFLGEMSNVLHSRAPLPLIPPTPFSHKGRRGSLGVLTAEMGDGAQELAKKPTLVSWGAQASPPPARLGARASRPHAALRPFTGTQASPPHAALGARASRTVADVRTTCSSTAPGCAGVPPARSPAPLHGDAGISPARGPGCAGVPARKQPCAPSRGREHHVLNRPVRMSPLAPYSADREQAPLYGAYSYTRCDIRRARLAVMNVTRNAIPSVITTLIAAHLYERVSL